MKTNKSFTKRIKVSKNGKLVTRKAGQNHFRARKTRRTQLANNRTTVITMSNKAKSRFLSTSSI